MATEVLNKVNPIGQLAPSARCSAVSAHCIWHRDCLEEEHTKGNLREQRPDLDNAADEDPEADDLHEDLVRDGCMRAWVVKEAEEEEARAEPSPLPAADVKEPVALAPEQDLAHV